MLNEETNATELSLLVCLGPSGPAEFTKFEILPYGMLMFNLFHQNKYI